MRVAHIRAPFAVLTSCALLAACGSGAQQTNNKQSSARAVAVKTASVALRPMPEVLRLSGTLVGDREAQLAAGANGRVLQSLLERGREVRSGDVLVVLDTRSQTLGAREAKAQAELAQAQAEIAKRECERFRGLHERGAITQLEYDRATDSCKTTSFTLGAASARAELAEQNVSDGVVRAPFSGVIDERFVEVGEYVRADSKVARLVVMDLLRLRFGVPETYLAAISPGAKIRFSVSAFPGEVFEATLRNVSPALRESTRDLVVEGAVPNPSRRLRPGMFAQVELPYGQSPQPTVPEAALTERDGALRLFVVSKSRAVERLVQVGARTERGVAVLRGVSPGEQVVLAPPSDLESGTLVQ